MEQFPVKETDLTEEIKKLINEKGLEVITSKIIRNHLETKFNCEFEECKTRLDNLTEQCIGNYLKEVVNKEEKVDEEEDEIEEKAKIEKIEKTFEEKTTKQGGKDSQLSDDSSESSDEDINEKSSKSVQVSNKNKKGNKRKAANNEPSTSKTSLDEENDDMVSSIKRRRSAAPLPKRTSKPKEKKEKGSAKRQTQFTKICALSPELSDLLGKSYMRRSDVVKGVWEYLKSNNLQDPKKKQFYFLDDPLKRIFGSTKTRFKAFGMMGDLRKHVKDVEFLDAESRRIAEAEIAKMMKEENKTNNLLVQTNSDTGEEEEEGGNDGDKLSNKSDDSANDEKINIQTASTDEIKIKSQNVENIGDDKKNHSKLSNNEKEELKTSSEESNKVDDKSSSKSSSSSEGEEEE
ncbi:hypothetical protein ACQ4LE_000792 [Meloidogyne hapla]